MLASRCLSPEPKSKAIKYQAEFNFVPSPLLPPVGRLITATIQFACREAGFACLTIGTRFLSFETGADRV